MIQCAYTHWWTWGARWFKLGQGFQAGYEVADEKDTGIRRRLAIGVVCEWFGAAADTPRAAAPPRRQAAGRPRRRAARGAAHPRVAPVPPASRAGAAAPEAAHPRSGARAAARRAAAGR